eukprot:TRINITY_DN2378_c0_g1_i1.p1 TRINITY_DN2378_c0_g1~~TRINITY_DN2378_c0_g1_i1.p1  ORF type:complete len:250 (-),score=47.14 TRINITY_DN2378_c0_g1_i1:104-790(-)
MKPLLSLLVVLPFLFFFIAPCEAQWPSLFPLGRATILGWGINSASNEHGTVFKLNATLNFWFTSGAVVNLTRADVFINDRGIKANASTWTQQTATELASYSVVSNNGGNCTRSKLPVSGNYVSCSESAGQPVWFRGFWLNHTSSTCKFVMGPVFGYQTSHLFYLGKMQNLKKFEIITNVTLSPTEWFSSNVSVVVTTFSQRPISPSVFQLPEKCNNPMVVDHPADFKR